ncbi:MAG: Fic family protein [Bacteriovoracaceae bacterium]|jgi:Fic family protein|nr:Fic family protein [Bacteriovoracaceae bacterium]
MSPPFTISNKIINLVSQIVRELGKIEACQLGTPDPQLRKQNRIKTIQATLSIEGNTLSLDQMTAVLEGKKVLGPQKEIVEVQNAIKLYDRIQSFKPFAVKDFLKAHKLLMASLVASAGSFRSKNVGVLKGSKVSHVAPKPSLVPELIEKLFNWAKSEKELHPLIKSCIFHYEIEFIHPFEDGNGRMGRFWQSVLLSKFESIFLYIPIESLIKENQKKYYQVLERSDKLGESTIFIEFILDLVLNSLKEFSVGIKGVTLDSFGRLKQARNHFEDNLFSRKEYMTFFKNISSSTASRDLKVGGDRKILEKSGLRNQTKYKFNE